MKNHDETPLFSKIIEYSNEDVTCFDVPGHKRGRYLSELNEFFSLKMDVNSSKNVDNLSNPTGVIKEAEHLLADAFRCSNAFMLVNGSTSGVQYMIMSAVEHGDKIVLPRNVHKSAINALILSGAKPIFIEPEIDLEYGIVNGITPKSLRHTLDLHNDVKAVLVINPTYFGATSNLEEIIEVSHSRNIPVLVDQAHGTHFSFHSDLPCSGSDLGADLITISMHKTGGSLTQSSVLLHNEGLISKTKVRSTINLFQTTSASYILMSSIDVARRKLVLEGQDRLDKLLKLTKSAKVEINKIPGLKCIERDSYKNNNGVYDYDELKLVVKVSNLGVSGFYIYDLLINEYSIQIELAEPNVILMIVSFGDDSKTLDKLVEALKDISRRFYNKNPIKNMNILSSLKNPKILLSPREAYYHHKKLMHIKDTEGLIAGESIMVYPPGIPIVIPGELITKDIINHYIYLKNEGTITLNEDDNPFMIQILDNSQEENMLDLWYTENHQDDTKFSIMVTEHIHSEKSEYQQIDFFNSKTFGKFFTLDGLMMVTEKDEFIYHDMITHIPMAVNPDIRKVLIIGGGDGGTAREVLRYPYIEKVDMVEIDERVVRLCQKYLPQTASSLTDERITLYFQDGLKFIQDAKESTYDLILVDSTDPIGPGEGLFTYEFYNNCKRVLTSKGILINQHESPYYSNYAHEMKRAHLKIKETFPIAKVYQFHMPTYPSGHWLFGFASKELDPIKDINIESWNNLNIKTKYYNTDLHIGSFMLPSYVRDELNNA